MKMQGKTCFVMMPISEPDGYERGHFALVYEHIIKPACVAAGFEPLRADEVNSTNYIALDVLNRIYRSDMALCDISGRNPNVLYELGLRHAFRKPVTIIKDAKTDRIFDIQGIRTIDYEHDLRIDKVGGVIKTIADAITVTHEAHGTEPNSLVDLIARGKEPTPAPADTSPQQQFGSGQARNREVRAQRGEVLEWDGRKGRIISNGRSFYTNSRFLARQVRLQVGSIVYFTVAPPMEEGLSEIAACVLEVGGVANGEVAAIRDGRYGFIQFFDANGNTRQVYFSLDDARPGVQERAQVNCKIFENHFGPVAKSVMTQRRVGGHAYARARDNFEGGLSGEA